MSHPQRRVVILAEGKFHPLNAKTAAGVIRYSTHSILAVIDSTQAGMTCQDVLGYGGPVPVIARLEEVLDQKPDVLLIGIAPTGGQLPDNMRATVLCALENHIEIWSGLHSFLADDPEIADLASRKNVRLWDVRRPQPGLTVATAAALKTRACVITTIGSDCNVGKMTTALEMRNRFQKAGYDARFVATGQTGILIEGEGTPLDAIPGDFMSGEVERLVCQCDQEGADVIFIEGQGALLHPGFGAVTFALILGSMPDAFLLNHQPTRETFRPGYDVRIPPLRSVIRQHEDVFEYYKQPKVLAIALNTYDLDAAAAARVREEIRRETGLPTQDPIRDGVDELFAAVEPVVRRKLGR